MTNEDKGKLKPDQYEQSPSGHCFVKSTTKKGILPQILDELLAARKRAKKDMAAATDPKIKEVQKDHDELFGDKESIEKFAREKYLMKKETEDIFVIVEE